MEENILAKSSCVFDVLQFWRAIEIWHQKPHCVNRRLCGIAPMFMGRALHPVSGRQLLNIILKRHIKYNVDTDDILMILESTGVKVESINSLQSSDWQLCITVRKLLPRNASVFTSNVELTILDKTKNEAIFISLLEDSNRSLSPPFPYSLLLDTGKIILNGFGVNSAEKERSILWLCDHLFPKILKWAEIDDTIETVQSLNLVSVERYSILYHELKEKYGQSMVKIWPERTDPHKFVYEDIAIATYLLLIWEDQRKERSQPEWRQSFVDLGCGNGLLVYILTSEGFPGIGIDVRKRRIWDLYPESTNLKVESFVPSESSVFPQTDWIIGNHSDELTPWIPVITAWSSYNCSFFLLPCCPYEFSGSKYKRVDSSCSQYLEYMNYVETICSICGFVTKIDKLRIPSTKRRCFIGMERNYPEINFAHVKQDITKFVNSKVSLYGQGSTEKQAEHSVCSGKKLDKDSLQHFKVRDQKEVVRNCTKLNRDLINTIIDHVVKLLLSNRCIITTCIGDGKQKSWNKGSPLMLSEIAASIPKHQLLELKHECGGLQTLLKNHHSIFSVCAGIVALKIPVKQTIEQKVYKSHQNKKLQKMKFKEKPCWFHDHHPDGCILKDEDCTYIHKMDIQNII